MALSANPSVSVIIPTYNRAATVLTAVNSVLAQDYAPLDLWLIDDGSQDGTKELLNDLLEAGLLNYFYQENSGVAAARNTGIKKSQGELIAFLDSDDVWLPGKIKAQVDFFQARPELRIAQTQEQWVRKGQRVNPKKKHLKKDGFIFFDSLALCLISPSAVMLYRSLLDEVGYFDERLLAAEDYDLWLRITARYQVGLLDKEFMVRYGGHPDQLSANHSIDRFRIMSLEKILADHILNPAQKKAAQKELERRQSIYFQALAKRQKQII